MKIEIFVTGIISTNCYVVSNEETKEAVIIDPAAYPKKMKSYLQENELQVKAILLTHEEEAELIADPILNESNTYTNGYTYEKAEYLHDGQTLDLIGYQFQVIHTPGHTSGGASYYVESEKVLFSGDTLFHGSVGRTDFKTSSMSALVHSIREKLFLLPDETVVYPGHMGATTIGTEKQINPYV